MGQISIGADMQTTLARAGYQILVASHEYDPEIEFEVVRVLQQRGVDALVLVGTDHTPGLWKSLRAWNKPSLLTEQVFNLNGGRSGLRALVAARQPPTAIFCGNDLLASGALLEAQRMGLKVPRQISICGIDNHELSEAINPGLTTIHLPTQDLGRITANAVLSAIAGEVIAAQSLLPFELVVRGRTASVPK